MTRSLTHFPPGTAVKIVRRTHGNDQPWSWEIAPNANIPAAVVHRAPRDDEVVVTVMADANGVATVSLPLGPVDADHMGLNPRGHFPAGRYWAVGQVDGAWQRVAFSSFSPW